MTDGELLAEFARARSETAFSELLRRHGAMVHGVCLRVTGRPEWAEEASQAAFLVLARKASAVSARPEIGGWLQRVAADLARDLLRSEARRRNRQEEAAQIRGSERSQTEAQDVALLRGLVDLELAALSEKQRQAIVGLYLEGHTRAELAKVLGIPEGTLAWRRCCRFAERNCGACSRWRSTRACRRGTTNTTANPSIWPAPPRANVIPC